jgi:1-acyl-sn-glycerol-3-phosphate acyltransferase
MAERPPTLLSRIVKAVLLWLFRWKNWEVEGEKPRSPKAVLLGAPHTSNWDFVFFLGVTQTVGIRQRFLGKTSLFKWPLTRFMYDMGGVPIDRSQRNNYVDQVIAAIKSAPHDFHLVIAPEGTRGTIEKWRSGFYHMAHGAGVPIIPAWVDNVNMRGGIGPEIPTTGDFLADLKKIADFYRSKMPDHPKLAKLYAMVEPPKPEIGE